MSLINPLFPVFYLTNSIVDPIAVEMADMRSRAMRAFTKGLFGVSFSQDDQFRPQVYDEPTSNADRLNGGICCVTGMWAPGHAMVTTTRGKAIRAYAPYDKVGRDRI